MSLTEEQEKTPLLAIPKLLRTKLLEVRDSGHSQKWEKDRGKQKNLSGYSLYLNTFGRMKNRQT